MFNDLFKQILQIKNLFFNILFRKEKHRINGTKINTSSTLSQFFREIDKSLKLIVIIISNH